METTLVLAYLDMAYIYSSKTDIGAHKRSQHD